MTPEPVSDKEWYFLSRQPRDAYEAQAAELGLKLCWGEEIRPGDLYIAGRNKLPQLFECKSIHERGWVSSTESHAYPYDCWECVKAVPHDTQ